MTQENSESDIDDESDDKKKIPGEPKGEPEHIIDEMEIYVYGEEGAVPEHLYVLERPEDVATRMWAFEAVDGFAMQFIAYVRHRYDEYNPRVPGSNEQCCYMKVFEMEEGEVPEPERYETGLVEDDCPERISDLVARLTDAPILFPNDDGEEDSERSDVAEKKANA